MAGGAEGEEGSQELICPPSWSVGDGGKRWLSRLSGGNLGPVAGERACRGMGGIAVSSPCRCCERTGALVAGLLRRRRPGVPAPLLAGGSGRSSGAAGPGPGGAAGACPV